jgi:hypothetical protein
LHPSANPNRAARNGFRRSWVDYFRRLKTAFCNLRNAVTPTDRGGEHVGDEEADRLRLLIVVVADSTLVAALRNRAEIALTHVNRQSP